MLYQEDLGPLGIMLGRFFFFKQKTAYDMLRSLVGSEMCIRDSASTRAQSPRRDGGGAAERFKPKRYVRAPGAARPHPETDGVRRECPEFAAPPRMTGLSAPRLGEARALLGTARPRRCLTATAVRGWAGTSRCRGTQATAGAAGGAGRTRSHECCPSVGAVVRPTAAAMGAESHRTALSLIHI